MKTMMIIGRVTNGRMTTLSKQGNKMVGTSTRIASGEDKVEPVAPISTNVNLPAFMVGRNIKPHTPAKVQHSANQQRTFAQWLTTFQEGDE